MYSSPPAPSPIPPLSLSPSLPPSLSPFSLSGSDEFNDPPPPHTQTVTDGEGGHVTDGEGGTQDEVAVLKEVKECVYTPICTDVCRYVPISYR